MVKIHQGAATATRKPKSIARCWRSCSGSRNNLFQSQKPPTTWCRLWTKLWMHVGCFLKCWNNQGLQGLGLKKWFRSCAALWSAEKQYQGYSNSTCMHVYTFLCVCVSARVFPVPSSVAPLPMVWYPPSLPKHLHGICSIWESQPPICMLCAAFQSHNLRLAPFLQQLKAICYDLRAVPVVTYLVSICFFSTVYTYIQAITYLYTIHQLPMIGVLAVLYPYIESTYYL